MAWDTTLVMLTRHLISDLTIGSETYDDYRIQEALVLAGILTSRVYEFDNDYTFDIETPSISPDPTVTATLDNDAMALFSLKAACILDVGRIQSNVDSIGVLVRDENTVVDTKNAMDAYDSIIKHGPCSMYDKILKKIESDKAMSVGKAVTSPGTHPNRIINYSASETARFFFDNYMRYRR